MPSISVLMPVFNAEKYVGEAIDSILSQTFEDFELVVLNDASQDSSKELILAYKDVRIRFIENEENRGLSYSRNRLLSEAKGTYVAWLDADDIAYPTRLAEEFEFLETHRDHAMVAAWARLVDSEGMPTGNFIKSYIPNECLSALLLFVNYFVQSSVMLRKELLPTIHYQSDFPPTEDYELWVRIAAKHPVAILSKTLVDYRIHATNISAVQEQKSKDTVQLNHRIQLQNLGITPSEEELDLHYAIAFGKAESLAFLEKTLAWLLAIEKQNRVSKRFDRHTLHYILKHRWLKVCTSNKELGIRSLRVYFKSELSELNLKTLFLISKYLV